MSDFNECIEVNGTEYNLSFQFVLCPLYNKYFVKAHRHGEEPIAFEMKKGSNDIWMLIDPVPVWIKNIQQQLSTIIEHHDKNRNSI